MFFAKSTKVWDWIGLQYIFKLEDNYVLQIILIYQVKL